MKKFKEVLAETSRSGGGMMPQYGRYPWDTSAAGYSPAVVDKINSIIGRYCIEDLVDAYSAVSKIRGTLYNVGLTFDNIAEDAADALAVAICHANTQTSLIRMAGAKNFSRKRLRG